MTELIYGLKFSKYFVNSQRCLHTVHHRHVDVHQNKVAVPPAALLAYVSLVFLEGLLTVTTRVDVDAQHSIEL